MDVEAEISGTIYRIDVSAGQKVSEEDVLVMMESMKMEIAIYAPVDGTIKEIVVSEGDAVQSGDIVLRIDT